MDGWIGYSIRCIIGKEIFGGTGMNVVNIALTARAFLFLHIPPQCPVIKYGCRDKDKMASNPEAVDVFLVLLL